jgi:hypothetical protein
MPASVSPDRHAQHHGCCLNRLVAVKLIRSGPLADPGELLRFRREAVAMA